MACCQPGDKPVLGTVKGFYREIMGYWFVISFDFFSWKIGLEMSISSETASALMFCHGEKLERNVVVCEQMASPQLLWQLVPGHLHTITWSCKMIFIMKCVIVHILSLIYLDFIWYYICCSRVFSLPWIKPVNSTEVPHPCLIRPGSGWVVTFYFVNSSHYSSYFDLSTKCNILDMNLL